MFQIKLICCYLLFVQHASCGLLGFGSEPKARPINRRMGPFINRPPQQQQVQGRPVHHPYMEERPQQWDQSHEFHERFDQSPQLQPPSQEPYQPPSFLENRQSAVVETTTPKKVLMPIISSGYASAKFQGGRYGVAETPKKDKKKVAAKKVDKTFTNDLATQKVREELDQELAIIEEIINEESAPSTTVSTTKTTITTTTTTTTATTTTPQPQQLLIEERLPSKPLEAVEYPGDVVIGTRLPQPPQSESSPYFPDIPDSVALSATEDVSQKYDQVASEKIDFLSGPTGEAVDIIPSDPNPFIITDADEIQPEQHVHPEIRQGQASVESVPVFDEILQPEEDDGLIVQPGDDVPLDVESGQFVRFVATPPKQVSVVVPNVQTNLVPSKPTPINVDEDGYFKPPRVEPSNIYQAGYQQTDFPHSTGGGQFPVSVNPDLIDPNDYHEDRPSFSSGTNKQAVKEYYPLGKPPPSNPAPEEITVKVATPKPEPPKEVNKPASSFLDFLIPSFIRGSSKTDPEGPPKQPALGPNSRPRSPPPPPPPRPLSQGSNRPLNTFPHPTELGGEKNPIRVRIGPDGIPDLPKPPGWNRPHDTLTKRKMFRLEQETPLQPSSLEETTAASSLKDDEIFAEIPDNQQIELKMPKLKLPMPPPRLPPSFSRPRPDLAPMPITARPFAGLPRVSFNRKPEPNVFVTESEEEFRIAENSGVPKRRQLSDASSLIPDKPEFTSVHESNRDDSLEQLQKSEDYKNKLSDPDFFQNITKALVFHATNLNDDDDSLRLDDAISSAPIQYSPNVFRIQDSNPFGERPDAPQPFMKPRIEEPTPFSQQHNQQHHQQVPQPKRIVPERLEEIAPAAKRVHQSKDGHVDRPEVVYQPIDVYGKKADSSYERTDFYEKRPELSFGPTFVMEKSTDVSTGISEENVESKDNIEQSTDANEKMGEQESMEEKLEATVPTEPPMLQELSETEETVGTTEAYMEPEATTALYIDPIAEHVNKLLRHYLTTQEPLKEVPSLLYDAETGSVVLEYVSPDGEHGRVEQPIQDYQDVIDPEESTLHAFQAVPEDYQGQEIFQDTEQRDDQGFADVEQHLEQHLDQQEIEPQSGKSSLEYTSLDQVFNPSSQVKDADWFVMDSEGKKRIMNQGMEDLVQTKVNFQEPTEDKEIIPEALDIQDVAQDRVDLPDEAQDRVDNQDESEESVTQTPEQEETVTPADMFVEDQTESIMLDRETEGGFQPVSNPEAIPDNVELD